MRIPQPGFSVGTARDDSIRQLVTLDIVREAVVQWNTRCSTAALNAMREEGTYVDDGERLPLGLTLNPSPLLPRPRAGPHRTKHANGL